MAAVSSSVADKFASLDSEGGAYVGMPGVTSNRLSVPSAAALQLTGDLDLRARVALDSWTPATYTGLVAKAASASTTDGYMLAVQTNGTLGLSFGTGVVNGRNSGTATGFAAGSVKWVRATLTVNNGATQNEARFYTSDDGTSWTQLGSTVTTAGIVAITTNTTAMGIGAASGGTNYPMAGRLYRAQVMGSINGSAVLDVDCSAITSAAATTFTATTGQTVTINKSAAGTRQSTVVMPITATPGKPRAAADSLTASDALTVSLSRPRAAADSLTSADAVARAQAQARAAADTLATSDSLARSSGRARATADSATSADAVATSFGRARAAADTLTTSDAVTTAATRTRAVADSLATSDTVAAVYAPARVDLTRAVADTLTASDTVARATTRPRTTAESLATSDMVTRQTTATRSPADSATFIDQAVVDSTFGVMVAGLLATSTMAASTAPTASMAADTAATPSMTASTGSTSTMTATRGTAPTMTGA